MLGDGFDVPVGAGDFDRIIVTAAMEQIPEKLQERLLPRRHPDRAGRSASRHADAGQGDRERTAASSARNWSTFASSRRCRASRASCKITDWRFRPTSYSQGLSAYLLGTCLLKTVFCCVRVSNHVPDCRVASLASCTAGRGAGADVGRVCRLQRRYADAPFRHSFPIPSPRSLKPPVRCAPPARRAPRAAAICPAAGVIRAAIPVPGLAAARCLAACRAGLSGQFGRACPEEGAGFRPMRRRPARRSRPPPRCRRARSPPRVRPCNPLRTTAARSSSAPATRSTVWRSAITFRPPRSCRPMATRARACCRPASN